MSRANPRKAVSALLPAPIRIGALGVEVRPFTLATFAVLEKIGSPMLPSDGPVRAGVFDLVPTLYAATHGPAECLDQLADGTFARRAIEWADTVPGTAMPLLKDAILRQVGTVYDVVPESPQKKTADTTAGSPPSPNGPAAPTAGPGARRSSKSPRPSSPSTGGRAAAQTARRT